jgi:hypothetical protein
VGLGLLSSAEGRRFEARERSKLGARSRARVRVR